MYKKAFGLIQVIVTVVMIGSVLGIAIPAARDALIMQRGRASTGNLQLIEVAKRAFVINQPGATLTNESQLFPYLPNNRIPAAAHSGEIYLHTTDLTMLTTSSVNGKADFEPWSKSYGDPGSNGFNDLGKATPALAAFSPATNTSFAPEGNMNSGSASNTNVNTTYTVNIASVANGSDIINNNRATSGTFAAGTTINVSATPESGYVFLHWDNGSTNSNYSFNLFNNVTLTPVFGIDGFTLATAVNPPDAGTIRPGGTYMNGTTVNVTAIGNNTNYTFSGWSFFPQDSGTTTNGATASVVMDKDRGVTANFSAPTYTLNVVSVPLNCATLSGIGTYSAGATAHFSATPFNGWQIASWNGDYLGGTNFSGDIVMDGNKTIYVDLSQIYCTLTLIPAPLMGGNTYGYGSFGYGQTVNFSATANPNYALASWTGDGVTPLGGNSAQTTMTSNKVVYANFSSTASLTINVNPPGASPVFGEGAYLPGTTVNFGVNLLPGWHVASWDGGLSGGTNITNASLTLTDNVTVNLNLTNIAITNPVSLTLTPYPSGSSVAVGAGVFNSGDAVSFSFSPNTNCSWQWWESADGVFGDVTTNGNLLITNNQTIYGVSTPDHIPVSINVNPPGAADVWINSPSQGKIYNGGILPNGETISCDTLNTNPNYTFLNWTAANDINDPLTGVVSEIIAGGSDSTTNTTYNVTAPLSITANYIDTPVPSKTLTLTIAPEAGISYIQGIGEKSGNTINATYTGQFVGWGYWLGATNYVYSGIFPSNDIVDISIYTQPYWNIDHWAGDFSATNISVFQVSMETDKSSTLYLTNTIYTLTVLSSDTNQGSVAISGATNPANVLSGPATTQFNFSAAPNRGFNFLYWTSDTDTSFLDVNGSDSIVLTNNKTLTAHFGSPLADVTIAKSGVGRVVVGGTYAYVISINNPSVAIPNTDAPWWAIPTTNVTASNVVVTDPVPAGMTITSASVPIGSISTVGNNVVWTIGDFQGDSNAQLTINVVPTTAGTFTNTATLTDTNDANQSDKSSTLVTTVANPTLTFIPAGNGETAYYDNATYDKQTDVYVGSNPAVFLVMGAIKVANWPATGTVYCDITLPGEFSLIRAWRTQPTFIDGNTSSYVDAGSDILIWNNSDDWVLNFNIDPHPELAGQTRTVTTHFSVSSSVTNVPTVTYDLPLKIHYLTNTPSLVVTKSGAADMDGVANYNYTITLFNASEVPIEASFVDAVPDTLNIHSISWSWWDGWSGVSQNGNKVTGEIPDLEPGTSVSVQVGVNPVVGAGVGDVSITNTATGASTTGSVDLSGATSSVASTIHYGKSQLTVTDSAPDIIISDGINPTTISYFITAVNSGNSVLTNVSVSDMVPSGLVIIDAYLAAWNGWPDPNVTTSGNSALGTAKTLNPAQSFSIVVDASYTPVSSQTADTLFTNTAVGSADNIGIDLSRATNSVVTHIKLLNGLLVSKTASVPYVYTDTPCNYSYSINVNNNTAVSLSTVSLTDTTPTGTHFISAQGATILGDTVTQTWDTIAPGETKTVTINAQSTADQMDGFQIINTATASSSRGDYAGGSATVTYHDLHKPVSGIIVSKTASTNQVSTSGGEPVVYTITVQNVGGEASPPVAVQDICPTNTTFVSATTPNTDGGMIRGTPTNFVATWSSIPLRATETFTVNAVSQPGHHDGDTITNTATCLNEADRNEKSTVLVGYVAPKGYPVVNPPQPPYVTEGSSIDWTVILQNAGNIPITNGEVDYLSPGNNGEVTTNYVSAVSLPAFGKTNITYATTAPSVPGTKTATFSFLGNEASGSVIVLANGSGGYTTTPVRMRQTTYSEEGCFGIYKNMSVTPDVNIPVFKTFAVDWNASDKYDPSSSVWYLYTIPGYNGGDGGEYCIAAGGNTEGSIESQYGWADSSRQQDMTIATTLSASGAGKAMAQSGGYSGGNNHVEFGNHIDESFIAHGPPSPVILHQSWPAPPDGLPLSHCTQNAMIHCSGTGYNYDFNRNYGGSGTGMDTSWVNNPENCEGWTNWSLNSDVAAPGLWFSGQGKGRHWTDDSRLESVDINCSGSGWGIYIQGGGGWGYGGGGSPYFLQENDSGSGSGTLNIKYKNQWDVATGTAALAGKMNNSIWNGGSGVYSSITFNDAGWLLTGLESKTTYKVYVPPLASGQKFNISLRHQIFVKWDVTDNNGKKLREATAGGTCTNIEASPWEYVSGPYAGGTNSYDYQAQVPWTRTVNGVSYTAGMPVNGDPQTFVTQIKDFVTPMLTIGR